MEIDHFPIYPFDSPYETVGLFLTCARHSPMYLLSAVTYGSGICIPVDDKQWDAIKHNITSTPPSQPPPLPPLPPSS